LAISRHLELVFPRFFYNDVVVIIIILIPKYV
jgi:hypothetical protein